MWPALGRPAFAAAAVLLSCWLGPVQAQGQGENQRPRLHLVTYSDAFDMQLVYPLSSASKQGLYPAVLGYGRNIGWGPRMGQKANAVRDFVFNNTEPDDVVVVFDGYDVMFQGGEQEIMDRYLEIERRTGRTLVINAEADNSYPEREAEFSPSEYPWRFLNSGVLIGRSRTLRILFKDPLPSMILDKKGREQRLQNWHIDFYLDHRDKAVLDSRCEIIQTVYWVEGVYRDSQAGSGEPPKGFAGLGVADGRVVNKITRTTPPILHFPGPGHWPDKYHPERVGTCCAYEVFRSVVHPDMAKLLEDGQVGPWKGLCSRWKVLREGITMPLERLGNAVVSHAYRLYASPWQSAVLLSILTLLAWRSRRWWRPTLMLLCDVRKRFRGPRPAQF